MTSTMDHVNGSERSGPWPSLEPDFDPVALAQAEAIRTRAEAEAEARRLAAEAEAEAVRIKAAAEAEKQALANKRAALQLQRFEAEQKAKIAEAERKAAAEARETQRERLAAEAAELAEAEADEQRQKSASSWRAAAIGFAVVCGVVALPVQMSAFYREDARYLLAAPLVLEGAAWVVLRGAAAAVDDRRPHWHYRLIAWLLAFVAAGVNLWHGLTAFDTATAVGTAIASLAGPGIWDLHEHGRIRSRDGKPTLRQRWAQQWAERKQAKQEAALAKERAAAAQADAEAEAAKAAQLAADREANFEKVWKHALKLAAALGETTVTEAIWKRAHNDIEGTDPGEWVDIIRGRNAAKRRLTAARSEAPGERPVKVNSAQVASQMPPTRSKRVYKPPTRAGVRRKNDTPKYVAAANRQASIAARKSTEAKADERTI
ncbi:hypothetical protein AB0953_16580 [Streptomyces sp. NPDC046866]|uniref:hypothetical protein n=1 Tax=Streptomyces sp. NPDC046866 TaxID=3154921 RepID=UPI00345222FC